MSSDFADPQFHVAHLTFQQLLSAMRNALSDIRSGPDKTLVYFLDFNVVHPLIAPRQNPNRHDIACASFLRNLRNYKQRSSRGFEVVYTPFLLLELFDHIEHRLEYLDKVLHSKTTEDFQSNLLSVLHKIPSTPEDVAKQTSNVVSGIASYSLRTQLQYFLGLIADGTIKSIYDFIGREKFMEIVAKGAPAYPAIEQEIGRFRRPSLSSDFEDREFHKMIDVATVVFIQKVVPEFNSLQVCYVGQDLLRRIFGSYMNERSRDALTPHIILQALTSIPSDRELREEAAILIEGYVETLQTMVTRSYNYRNHKVVPYGVVQKLYHDENRVLNFIFDKGEMATTEQYKGMLNMLSDQRKTIESIFGAARDDAKSAKEMLRQMADSAIAPDIAKLQTIFPSARLEKLLDELHKPLKRTP